MAGTLLAGKEEYIMTAVHANWIPGPGQDKNIDRYF